MNLREDHGTIRRTFRQDRQIATQKAEDAFAEWWQDVGCVKSEQIAVTLTQQTPQEWMQELFVEGFLMGFQDR